MELAKQCSEVPWTLPESAVFDPDQSAPPSQALAKPRTTDAAVTAAQSAVTPAEVSATTAPDVAQQAAVPPLPHAVIEPDSSAIHAAATLEITAPPSASSDSHAAAAAPGSTSPIFSAAQTHVQTAISSAAPPDRKFFAPHGSSVSSQFEFADDIFPKTNKQKDNIPKTATSTFEFSCVNSQAATINAVVTKIPSASIDVRSALSSDKQVPSVLSSGTLNFQVPSSFSLCSKSESRVILPFHSSQSHNINFGSFSQPMTNESASDLASSEKLVSDVIKSHDVSLVAKLPTSDLSLDSISVSIPENQYVPLVSVPLSALDQCNPVASRTRKSKAKLANRVIPVAPSVKRKLVMDSVSDVEPPRKSQKSMSTRQLRGQVSVPHSLPKSSGFPLPILLNKDLQAAWLINKDRSLLLQRNIDVENFTACCNLIDLLRSQNLLQTVTNVGPYCDLFSPDYDLIASSLSNSHYRTWPKRDTKKPGKQGDLESSFLPSSYAILLRMATTNWLPTVTVHSVSKKMVVLLFKIRNNIPFNLGELIFDHIMAFRHGQGKENKVLLPFSSLIYGILCKQGFRKHPQEEELSPTSLYSIDRRLFFKSHLDDCSTFKSAVVPEGESVSSTRSRVSVDFAAVSARVLTTQSILKSLKSTVVQMEKVLLEDKKLLQSFETDDEDLDSAR
nr:uncharacterized protein LOC109185001 [Ipomoea trifida]